MKGWKTMILITGGNGQLGTDLRHLLDEQGTDYVATDVKELDITDEKATMEYITKMHPTLIYHCAAYTAVDKAEEEGKDLDEAINVTGTRNVALAAKAVDATLVYVSTDYVFDGRKKDDVYRVEDQTNPLNEYGRTKLLGEEAVAEILEKYYIIRTSWVFGQYGHNFVFTMQKLAQTHDKLTVVNDQFGRPTWTRTLAEFMTFVIDKKAPFGIYQLSNQNSCSWYEFAKEILKDETVEVLPVTSEEYPQKATRPQYAVMDLSKAEALGFVIPTWEEALAGMLRSVGGK
ncbi:dTDP-4-dehydrorhamnose reductase [Enterococcus faecium EnGen0184]|nr:dTDP-4-dehydrorhamnose reductase [Enterococcus faecium EnGen0184]